MRVDPDEVDALDLAGRAVPDELVLARPDARPDVGIVEADLLRQLASQRLEIGLARLDAAAGRRPEGVPSGRLEANEQ